MILSDFRKALTQVLDPALLGVLLRSILLTIIVLVIAAWGLWELVSWVLDWLLNQRYGIFSGLVSRALEPWIMDRFGEFTIFGEIIGISMTFLVFFAMSAFLMVPTTMAIIGLFADEIANTVERRHYPNLDPAKGSNAVSQFASSLMFFFVVLVANAIALVIYLAFPPLAPFIFFAMNGYLLGSEYFLLCALRRERRVDAEMIRRRYGASIWLAGSGLALLLTIPIVNLFVPLIGIASFTHTYHRYKASGSDL